MRTRGVIVGAVATMLLSAGAAFGQLAESNVLVVYDSRIADSLAVAEYYAGSANVPGGAGGLIGKRPGVLVVDMASLAGGGQFPAAHTISYPNYVSKFRDPLRAFLDGADLEQQVRCIVLTKGLPHRVDDHDNAGIGDNPGGSVNEFTAGDATNASLDIELSLLWQNIDTGEAGGPADSRADGIISNPYGRSIHPVLAYPSGNIRAAKTFSPFPGWTGALWVPAGTGAARLTPGDIYLVTRLDGNTVPQVRSMIDRAVTLSGWIDVDTEVVALVLDESNSDGVANAGENGELDNQGPTPLRAGDDYEQSRDRLLTDGRFLPPNVRYNALSGAANFIVGPLLSFDGEGLVVSDPLLLLASEGDNHAGPKPGGGPGPDPAAGPLYAASFNYADGAVFNSIESYNGRVFGGAPQFGNQEQAADFIAAGGTGAMANVWEPFTISIPDNHTIVQNYFLGGMTFAEAACTSIPGLSWHQIVVGDPLTRIERRRDDVDASGRVQIDDLYTWHEAVAGPAADLNRSGTADDADRRLLESSLRFGEAAHQRLGQQ